MKPLSFFQLRSGLIALGVLAGLSATATAGPAGYVAPPAQPALNGAAGPDAAAKPTLVGWVCTYGNRCRDTATGAFRTRGQIKGNSHVLDGVRRGDRAWNGNRRWSNNWEDGRRYKNRRHYRRHYDRGPNIVLGLGLGGLGWGLSSGYYDPYYSYAPPRRVYRQANGLSQAHVAWCYDRWLSYRAWDNTYQPNRGPRKQCWSPYS